MGGGKPWVTRRVERACQRQETGVALPGGGGHSQPADGQRPPFAGACQFADCLLGRTHVLLHLVENHVTSTARWWRENQYMRRSRRRSRAGAAFFPGPIGRPRSRGIRRSQFGPASFSAVRGTRGVGVSPSPSAVRGNVSISGSGSPTGRKRVSTLGAGVWAARGSPARVSSLEIASRQASFTSPSDRLKTLAFERNSGSASTPSSSARVSAALTAAATRRASNRRVRPPTISRRRTADSSFSAPTSPARAALNA